MSLPRSGNWRDLRNELTPAELMGTMLDELAPAPVEPLVCKRCQETFLFWATYFVHLAEGHRGE